MSDHQQEEMKDSTRQQPATVATNPASAIALHTRSRSSAAFTTPADAAMLSQPLFPDDPAAATPFTPQEEEEITTNIGDTHRRLTLAPSQTQPSTLQSLFQAQTNLIISSFERGQQRTEASLNSIASAFNTLIQQSQTTNSLLERLVNPNGAQQPQANSQPVRNNIDNQAAAAAQTAGARLANVLAETSTDHTAATPAIPLVIRTNQTLVPHDGDYKHRRSVSSSNDTFALYPHVRDTVHRTRRFLGNEKRKRLDKITDMPAAQRTTAQNRIENYFERLHQQLNDSAEQDIMILDQLSAAGTDAPVINDESHLHKCVSTIRSVLTTDETLSNATNTRPIEEKYETIENDDPKTAKPKDKMKSVYDLLEEEPSDDSRPPSPADLPDRDYSFNVNTSTASRRRSRVLDTSAREDRNEGHADREIHRLWSAFLDSPAGTRLAAAKIQRRQLFHETDKSNCNDLNAVLADMEQTIDRYAIPRLHDTQKQSLFIAYFLAPQSTFLDDARKWQRQGLSWATFVHKMQEQHGVTDVILENALAKFAAKYAEDTPRQAYHAFRRHVQALVNARRLKEMSRARPTANAASYTMPPGEYEAHFVRAIERPFENFDVSRYKFFVNWKRDHQAADAQSTGIDHEKRVNWLQLAYEEVQKNDKRQSRNETNDDRPRHDRSRFDRSRDARYPRRPAIAVNNTYPESDSSDIDDAYERHSQHFDDYIDGHADEHTPSIHYANTTGSYGPPKHQWMNSFRGQQRNFPQRPTRCMFCSADGHYMADCPLVVRVKQLLVQQPHLSQPAPIPALPQRQPAQNNTSVPSTTQGQQRPHATNNAPRVHFAEASEDAQYDC